MSLSLFIDASISGCPIHWRAVPLHTSPARETPGKAALCEADVWERTAASDMEAVRGQVQHTKHWGTLWVHGRKC